MFQAFILEGTINFSVAVWISKVCKEDMPIIKLCIIFPTLRTAEYFLYMRNQLCTVLYLKCYYGFAKNINSSDEK